MARNIEIRYSERDARRILELAGEINPLVLGAEPRVKRVIKFEDYEKGHMLQPGDVLVVERHPHDRRTHVEITDQKGKEAPTVIEMPGMLMHMQMPQLPIRINHGGEEFELPVLPPSAAVLSRNGHVLVVGKENAYVTDPHIGRGDAEKPKIGLLGKEDHIIATHEGHRVLIHNVGKRPVRVRIRE
ncbi:MAG: hypothetical protein GXN93_01350 [Candidatus Diapherotrites archaeon]|nr:hypothetical protein [Candidatus Diapherotrites archaeon]